MQIIENPQMPKSNGHYSMCIEHNGSLYISGQLPKDSNTGLIPNGIEAQTELVLTKLETILNAAGSTKDKVISMRLYISDIEMWEKVNNTYAVFFGNHKPARAVVPTKELHYGCLIEIEAIAAV